MPVDVEVDYQIAHRDLHNTFLADINEYNDAHGTDEDWRTGKSKEDQVATINRIYGWFLSKPEFTGNLSKHKKKEKYIRRRAFALREVGDEQGSDKANAIDNMLGRGFERRMGSLPQNVTRVNGSTPPTPSTQKVLLFTPSTEKVLSSTPSTEKGLSSTAFIQKLPPPKPSTQKLPPSEPSIRKPVQPGLCSICDDPVSEGNLCRQCASRISGWKTDIKDYNAANDDDERKNVILKVYEWVDRARKTNSGIAITKLKTRARKARKQAAFALFGDPEAIAFQIKDAGARGQKSKYSGRQKNEDGKESDIDADD